MFYRTRVVAARKLIFNRFCTCDLDLDPMTFIYESDPYSLEIYLMYEYELVREGFQTLSSDRQTDTHDRNYATLQVFKNANNLQTSNIK